MDLILKYCSNSEFSEVSFVFISAAIPGLETLSKYSILKLSLLSIFFLHTFFLFFNRELQCTVFSVGRENTQIYWKSSGRNEPNLKNSVEELNLSALQTKIVLHKLSIFQCTFFHHTETYFFSFIFFPFFFFFFPS